MAMEKRLAYRKKCVDEISDSYVKDLLCRDGRLARSDVTKELIELKREQLLMWRLTNKLRQQIQKME